MVRLWPIPLASPSSNGALCRPWWRRAATRRRPRTLHKSQSTVTYAVQKIERLLDVKLFEIRGRKAVLTEAGQVLYRRARTLLEEAAPLERGAAAMAEDWQPEIRIAVEIVFPTWLLLECLAEFAVERPETRIEVFETVLTGTQEMLAEGRVDFAIGSQGASIRGAALMAVRFIAVAHPSHPLHQLGRPLTARDLKRHRRIFIRDTGTQRKREVSGRRAALDGEPQGDLDPRRSRWAWASRGCPRRRSLRRSCARAPSSPLPLKEGGERASRSSTSRVRRSRVSRARCGAARRDHSRRTRRPACRTGEGHARKRSAD